MLKIIRGLRYPEKEIEDEPGAEASGLSKLARQNEDGKFEILKGGQKKISAHFKTFYVNRSLFETYNQKRKYGVA